MKAGNLCDVHYKLVMNPMDRLSVDISFREKEDFFDQFMRWIDSVRWTWDNKFVSPTMGQPYIPMLVRAIRNSLDENKDSGHPVWELKRSGNRETDRARLTCWLYGSAHFPGPFCSPPWTRTFSDLCAVVTHLDMVGMETVDLREILESRSQILKEIGALKQVREAREAYTRHST